MDAVLMIQWAGQANILGCIYQNVFLKMYFSQLVDISEAKCISQIVIAILMSQWAGQANILGPQASPSQRATFIRKDIFF